MYKFAMRCSSRDPGILCPSFITSTPLPRRRTHLHFDQTLLSPIAEAASSAPKFTLHRASFRTKLSTAKNQKSIFDPTGMSSRKENNLDAIRSTGVKRKRETNVQERPSNFLEEFSAENKKGGGRISRVEAILDEIVKESLHKSNISSYSPSNIKLKSDESVDAMIDQVAGSKRLPLARVTRSTSINFGAKESIKIDKNHQKNSCLDVKEVNNIAEEQVMKNRNIVMRNTRTRKHSERGKSLSSALEEKENLVRKIVNGSQEVEILRIKQCINPKSNVSAKKMKIVSPDSMCKSFANNENVSINSQSAPSDKVPVIYKLSEIDWQPTKHHEGVSISKMFKRSNTSEGYVKLDAKCLLKKTPSSDQVFIICEGSGEVKLNNSKTKIGIGDTIRVPSGYPYEFFNRGVKKPLIMSYTFWK